MNKNRNLKCGYVKTKIKIYLNNKYKKEDADKKEHTKNRHLNTKLVQNGKKHQRINM